MKVHIVITGLTTVTLLLGGCSNIPNPFEKEEPVVEKPAESQNNNQTEQEETPDPEKPKQEEDEKNHEADGPALPSLEETVTVTADGKKVVTNLDSELILVNKERNLPADYAPEDLVVPDVPFPFTKDLPKKQLKKVAARAVEELFAQAEKDSIPLFAQSGYRSYDRQDAIFTSNANQHGEEAANKFSAYPGQSEHQSGLALDVTSPAVEYKLIEAFGETEAGIWVKENAYKFGFIVRYPKGSEHITGYQYEPWHLRYVGKEHAKRIHEQNVTLEEYLGVEVEAVNATE